MINPKILNLFRVEPGKKLRLKDHDTGWAQTKELKELGKDRVKARAREILETNLQELAQAQDVFYAADSFSTSQLGNTSTAGWHFSALASSLARSTPRLMRSRSIAEIVDCGIPEAAARSF